MLTFGELRKNLKKDYSGFKEIKVAILADNASQLLHTALRGIGYEMQVSFDIYEADYNQIDLQVFDASSELYQFRPDFVFINQSSEKLLTSFCRKDLKGQSDFASSVVQTARNRYDFLTARLKAKVIINTYPEIHDRVFGNFGTKICSSFIYQLRLANLQLMELSQQMSNLFICDIAALQSQLGYGFVFDPKMYVNADMVYSIDFLPFLASNLADIVLSITGTFKKCVIVDLDNTMWGGIIGDDGMEGIQIGHLGSGKIFTELQLWIRQLKRRGIIVAVCSKNTEEIAKEPFISHPDMVLRLEDIAVFAANWNTKVENIRYIQSVLNIGFDSMVFLDDNPFEREMVKSGIPGIAVPDLPEDPAEYLVFLRGLNLFETASFTEEDEVRTKQYQEEANRNMLQQSFENESDFLASLEMVSEVKPFDKFSIPRVAQLTQRSNQFNLRTVRYTEDDVRVISSDPSYFTLSLTLADRFGDHGLIGLIILKRLNDSELFIDSWIMSCRVLKRGMESFTLNAIVDLARRHNFKKIVGEYLPTKKNGIVKDHFLSLGFSQAGDKWELAVAEFKNHETHISLKSVNV